jgi:hypothetical protein
MLLQLPRELRDQIYLCLFDSTRLAFGKRRTGSLSSVRIRPNPNALAMLRTCHQINEEAGPLWLNRVLFSFEGLEDLLDKLSPLPSSMLSEIRHIRTGGQPLMLQPVGYDDDVYYRPVWVMKLLPSLRLDTLTVFGSNIPEVAYDTLEGFIEHGNGWKELCLIVRDSAMLSFESRDMWMANPYRRKPQPSTWNNTLRLRDGDSSGTNLTIYRSIESNTPGSITNPLARHIFEQKVSSPEELDTYGMKADTELLAEGESEKELMFVVKRGHGADITEWDEPPYDQGDIRDWSGGMTWAEIKRQCIYIFNDDSDEESDAEESRDEVLIDTYKNVDDIAWPRYG